MIGSRAARWLVIAAVMVAAVMVAARCTDSSAGRGPSEYDTAYRGLCRAASEARQDKLDDARRTFLDQSHGPLHQLAAAVQTNDRAVAGRLLEAKHTVEAELQRPTANALADKLTRLAAYTATAVSAAGEDRPEPCPTEEP